MLRYSTFIVLHLNCTEYSQLIFLLSTALQYLLLHLSVLLTATSISSNVNLMQCWIYTIIYLWNTLFNFRVLPQLFLSAVKIRFFNNKHRLQCTPTQVFARIASTHTKTHTQLTHSRQYILPICASKFSYATKALLDLITFIEFSLTSTHINTIWKHWRTTV